MEIRCIASTHLGHQMTKEAALSLGGKAAGVCYMANDIESILTEEKAKTDKRIGLTLGSGHHSVYEHATFNLYLEGIPKILAMILNNEREYVTSEKSARYTKMKAEGKEKELYDKWTEKLQPIIRATYPMMKDLAVKKKAMENARYFISVFTPATNMMYTVNLRQINYILHWCKDFIEKEQENSFTLKVKEALKEFIEKMQFVFVPEIAFPDDTRGLTLFDKKKEHKEHWGETYCTTYLGSFAQLAQAHRHRTIGYAMTLPEKTEFYVPDIVKAQALEQEWLDDMNSIKEKYPQGMLVRICETGRYKEFAVSKCRERLCGQAQLEIMQQTAATLKEYIKGVENYDQEVYEELKKYDVGTRCNWGYKCNEPCIWGRKAISRLV